MIFLKDVSIQNGCAVLSELVDCEKFWCVRQRQGPRHFDVVPIKKLILCLRSHGSMSVSNLSCLLNVLSSSGILPTGLPLRSSS